MFRKVIESISRSLASSKPASAAGNQRREPTGSALERVVKTPAHAARAVAPEATAEQLCGVRPGMGKPEIAALLKKLYRRHNRAASSLDATLRAESERMLDAIVEVREKHFGRI